MEQCAQYNVTALPKGFYEYESVSDALNKAVSEYKWSGKTNLYSTGYSILDEYLGGGFGKTNSYELILIHSQSKMMKSTIATSIMMDSLSKGVKQGWIVLEGTFSEALMRARRCAPDYEKFDAMMTDIASKELTDEQQLFYMSDKMKDSDYTLDNLLMWMQHLYDMFGVKLFFIDPIGYAFDFSVRDKYDNEWSRQARFMQRLSRFCSINNITVVIIQHNTKDNDYKKVYREAAIGGSSTLPKSATKVIEIRREKTEIDGRGKRVNVMSIEYYKGRHTKDYYGHPIIMKVYERDDGIGTDLFFPTFRDQISADECLNNKCSDIDRSVWWGQVNDNL